MSLKANWLRVNVSPQNDFQISFSSDYPTNDTNFWFSMTDFLKNDTNSEIGLQQKSVMIGEQEKARDTFTWAHTKL